MLLELRLDVEPKTPLLPAVAIDPGENKLLGLNSSTTAGGASTMNVRDIDTLGSGITYLRALNA